MTSADQRAGDITPILSRMRPSGWAPWVLLASLGLIVTAAWLMQFLPNPNTASIKRDLPLADYFPYALGGWTGEDRPLGETESVSSAAEKILGYDEVFQRTYRKKGQEFVLYVAYWSVGKMPAREVAAHRPDLCWVGVGWKRTAVDYHYPMAIEGHRLAPAQYREFDAPGDHEYVLYWHILNSRTILYSGTQLVTIKALLRQGIAHKGEQYFIRLSSPIPPGQLCQDGGFQAIMELVAPLGPGLSSGIETY